MNTVPEELRQRFRDALRQVMHNTFHTYWKNVRKLGFSMSQVFALRYIHRCGPCNISDIAKALGITNAAASQMLQKLVAHGYVVREENPTDRRNKRLSLTPKGEQALKEITPSWETTLDKLMANSTPEEIAQLAAAFELLLSKMPASATAPHPTHKPPCH